MRAVIIRHFDYTLSDEVDTAEPTVFKLRQLTGMERIRMGALVNSNADEGVLSEFVVERGLVGWQNLQGEDGQVLFSKNMERNIALLTADVISELSEEISSKTLLGDDEKKK